MADLPTEQEFMQGQDTRAPRSTEGSALAKGLTQMKHDVAGRLVVTVRLSNVLQCTAFVMPELKRALLTPRNFKTA